MAENFTQPNLVFKRIIHKQTCHACGLKCCWAAFVQQLLDGSVRFWHKRCVDKIQSRE